LSSSTFKQRNMKFLVLASTIALCSGAPFYGLVAHPNGAVTPVDEPAVAAARAEHLAAKGAVYAAGVPTVNAAPAYAPAYGYAGPLNLNTQLVAHPNGAVTPLDEPAVAAARADHLAAKGVAYAAVPTVAAPAVAAPAVTAPAAYAPAYGYAGPLNLNAQLVAHPNGAVTPLDEPAVAAARADHLAAHGVTYAAAATAAVAGGVYAAAAPVTQYGGLVAHPNGAVTPLDEPAVAAARADHLAAHGVAYAAAAPVAVAGGVYAAAAPVAPYGGLVAHPNGAVTPLDEPAVAAARADHLAAHGVAYAATAPVAVAGGVYAAAAPVAPHGGLVAHPNGAVVPLDEPAVAAARAEHLALLG